MNQGKVILKSGKNFHGVTLWSFQIEGSRRFWRCGRDEPPMEEGQWIQFEADQSGNVDMNTIKVVESGANEQEKNSTDCTVSTPVIGVPSRVHASLMPSISTSFSPTTSSTANNVGERMRYQAARADACRIVVAALHTDHLPHASNVAKGKRLELLEGYVEQVTKTLLEQEERNT